MPAFRFIFSTAVLVSVWVALRCESLRRQFDADSAYGDLFTCTRRISAPASAKASAMACPIPRVPPVTMAVCPSRENIDGSAEVVMLFKAFAINASRRKVEEEKLLERGRGDT